MSTLARVKLWGRVIGAVSLREGGDCASFEYAPDFAASQIEVSPIAMPLSEQVYAFPALPTHSFHGLPGLLADALPDRYGNALVNAWLARQGRRADSFNAVERLCYTGRRAMGALEFLPSTGPEDGDSERVDVAALVALASKVLCEREGLSGSFGVGHQEHALRDILRVGTSAGGARAKAVVAYNPETDEVRSGQVSSDVGFEQWLLKFDGVSGNRDKELDDPVGFGAIEFAYHKMALAAGVTMNPCRLLEENGRRHFMTRRFDRLEDGSKLHMQSLGALAHFDFNAAGAHSYEQALLIMRRLGLPMDSLEQQFRRMVFNVMARNQDDHVKNIAFLMDRQGHWRLSPAFDMTYAYNPSGDWTSQHQMSVNGKRRALSLSDLSACAKTASLMRSRALAIIEDVRLAVSRWKQFAAEVGVADAQREVIQRALRLEMPAR